MIMQEFETRRNQTVQKTSVFDNVPILVSARRNNASFSSTSCAPVFSEEIPINKKPQGPFPYLKRKSIRVDLVLKQQAANKKKNSAKKLSCKKVVSNTTNTAAVETLRKEKKALEEENAILKGRLMQMEKMFREMTSFYRNSSPKNVRNQECQTESKSTSTFGCQTVEIKKQPKATFTKCSKCNKCVRSTYLKHHQRFCGNTNVAKLLNEKDLKRLQIIRKNSRNASIKPKNNWRKIRQDFLNQIKKDKMKNQSSNCLLAYKRNFRK